ncbi:LysR family transcriptional regulator [Actinomadura sp. NTSP31]|uniref:LysR family transcriptional regulator n=1 Tax=Actinomadura sp. NTSP31 TaxID=1735447 RepID=UPI0035C031F3
MELRQLRYFVAVAEEANLTRAAERLGLRSPSLSQQIRGLERELGAALFDRTAAGMELTPAGAALLPEARAALEAAGRGARAVAAASAATVVLAVGVPPGVPPDLPGRIGAAARDARVRPVFEDAATDLQLAALRRRALDLAVVTLPADLSGLAAETVHDEPLGVLMADGHRLARRDAIAWRDLDGERLLWFDRALASGYHDAVLDACRAGGWEPEIRVSTARRAVARAELASGEPVVALRPAWAAEPGLVWRPIAGAAPRLGFALAWHRDPGHPAAEAIARRLRR